MPHLTYTTVMATPRFTIQRADAGGTIRFEAYINDESSDDECFAKATVMPPAQAFGQDQRVPASVHCAARGWSAVEAAAIGQMMALAAEEAAVLDRECGL